MNPMMNPTTECPREPELVEAIASGRYSDGRAGELRDHATTCPACADLAGVAIALRADFDHAVQEATIPPSGAAWWRAQRRAQQEAARTAARAVTFVQVSTLAGTAAAVLAILGGLSLLRQDWSLWLTQAQDAATRLLSTPTVAEWSILLAAVGLCLMLAPFALYYALTED